MASIPLIGIFHKIALLLKNEVTLECRNIIHYSMRKHGFYEKRAQQLCEKSGLLALVNGWSCNVLSPFRGHISAR